MANDRCCCINIMQAFLKKIVVLCKPLTQSISRGAPKKREGIAREEHLRQQTVYNTCLAQ